MCWLLFLKVSAVCAQQVYTTAPKNGGTFKFNFIVALHVGEGEGEDGGYLYLLKRFVKCYRKECNARVGDLVK